MLKETEADVKKCHFKIKVVVAPADLEFNIDFLW